MVNLGTLGSLMVELKAEGFKEAEGQMQGMQKSTKKAGDEAKRSVPQLEKMGKRWASVLSLVAASGAVAFGLIAKSSPSVMGALKGIQLAFESIFMIIGEKLAPVFEWFEGILWKVYEWFEDLSPTTQTFIAGLVGAVIAVAALAAGFLAYTVIAPIVAGALAALGVTLGTAVLIIGAVVVAIALLYTAWQTNFMGIRDIAKSVIDWLKEKWTKLMDIWKDENKTTWDKIKETISLAIEVVKDIIWGLVTAHGKVTDAIKEAAKTAWEKVKEYIITSITDAFNFVTDKLGVLETKIKDTVAKVKGFFTGGSSGGGGTDRTQYDSSGRVSLHQRVVSARAMGGPVMSGASYLVGENGPEMFTPKSTGNITSAGQTKTAMNNPTKAPDLNQKIVVQLDGRTIWESIRKYQTTELRRGGVY